MKRRAGGLLALSAGAYLLVTVIGHGHGWSAPVQATFEGSMVGGLADWFAVTALFRRPLGLPIPHTAIIRERKDQFGQTLSTFVVENFLSPDAVIERLHTSSAVDRAAAWVAEPANAAVVSRQGALILSSLIDATSDDEVSNLIQQRAQQALQSVPLVPVLARVLKSLTAEGLHQELLDAGLRALGQFLDQHHDQLRDRFGRGSPWWMPGRVEDRIFERLLDRVRDVVNDVNADPHHELRGQFDEWIRNAPDRLESSPDLLGRLDGLRRELAGYPELREWTVTAWRDLKANLRAQARDEDSELRRQLTGVLARTSAHLVGDEAVRERLDHVVESAVRAVLTNFHEELTALVTGTIARWDADETSDKLELLLGPDLQFIRINGTVVGGLAGLAIHTIGSVIN